MKVVIVGQGYVGLPLAMSICAAGHEVIGFDLNSIIVSDLNSGISHIEDIDSTVLSGCISSGKYRASSTPSDFAQSEIAIIAVPTPLDTNRLPDVSYVESASKILGENLATSALIINESTSYPGTLRNIIVPSVEKHSPASVNHSFAISPERVDPGNRNWKIKNTPRLYAGLTPDAAKKAAQFYSTFCDTIMELSTPETAEAAKLFENTFRQVNIALVNEFSLICQKLGINVHEVLKGAATKPYGFMKFSPGIGVGGHCIPVDPIYLAHAAEKVGVTPSFINLANKVNLGMPNYIAERIGDLLGGNLLEKKILVCGIAYKANISDVRETPSAALIEILRNNGAEVSWHDPLVQRWLGEESHAPKKKEFDLTFVAIVHSDMDLDSINMSSEIVFDATGIFTQAAQL